MATVTNPTTFSLFSQALRASIPGESTITGVDQALAEEACASGVFILGEHETDEVEAPTRRRSARGAQVAEEAVEEERETR